MRGAVLEELEKNPGINAATTRVAAVTNHLSCKRSSPVDLRKRTTSATSDSSSAVTIGRMNTNRNGKLPPDEGWLYGCVHAPTEKTMMVAVAGTKAQPTNHAAGRHRLDSSWPVGNSRKSKGIVPNAINPGQLPSHAKSRPAGRDPGSTTRACTP